MKKVKLINVKLSDLVPIGEIWFVDSKKIIRTRVKDVNSFADIEGYTEPLPPQGLPEVDIFRTQLKSGLEVLLREKTGWGRVELLRRLTDLIDHTGSVGFADPGSAEDECPF